MRRFLPKTLKKRFATWRKKGKRLVYWRYVLHRITAATGRSLSALLDAVLRFVHAAPRWPNGKPGDGLAALKATCAASKVELFISPDIHAEPALDFVRSLNADLGLVFGTKILKPALFEIPKQGSINIHKRKVPDYRGGGAVGLWELLDNQKEIGVTVHRVEAKVDVGAVFRSALIPIEPFDDLESLALKADVLGADLIVATIRDFANGTVTETPQVGPSQYFRKPTDEDLLQMKKKLAAQRKSLRPSIPPASLGTVAQVSGVCRARHAPQLAAPLAGRFPGDDPPSPSGFRPPPSLRCFDRAVSSAGELLAAPLSCGQPERGGRDWPGKAKLRCPPSRSPSTTGTPTIL